ncbi:Rha family transcriptional regulator [Ancylobacter pratisalsi]|uniref:Antirepressor protein C-terminal domain-containing protein n=1 Tax=Ancylobacter pratisalsi TaxID=1745854 RepID=A0A6P1YUM7_9HYPH|nr:phage regulatory protein/antirepressor Ant [Ancylobacter pratisalsi]QIB36551.1 hypothetical protein G3A50_22310 [Ancylobacter pratisalsi]
MLPVVSVSDGIVIASSLDVAAYFDVDHRAVLLAVDGLLLEAHEVAVAHFREHHGERRHYDMTRGGLALLARSLNGPQVARWRERYLDAFDRQQRAMGQGGALPARQHQPARGPSPAMVPAMPAGAAPLTMSSREIAELLGNRHDNVKRTIDTLAERGIIGRPQFEDRPFTDAQGKSRSEKVYLVGKRDSYVIVAQLSPEFTAALVDRWQKLEEQHAHPAALFNPSDPRVVAAFLAHWHQEASTAQAALADATGALAQIEAAQGSLSITDAAKALSHPVKPFFAKLYRNRWTYRRGGKGDWLAHADRCRAGLMDHRPVTYERDGQRVLGTQAMVTPKGLRVLADRLATDPSWQD